MFILGIVIGAILGIAIMCFIGVDTANCYEELIQEYQKEDKALYEENKELRNENSELKELRLQKEHNNTVLIKRNTKLEKVVNELEKLTNEQQFNSVLNMQNKIKSILMTAKSK